MYGKKFLCQSLWHSLVKLSTKNYENSSIFVKVTAKKSVAPFFWTRCIILHLANLALFIYYLFMYLLTYLLIFSWKHDVVIFDDAVSISLLGVVGGYISWAYSCSSAEAVSCCAHCTLSPCWLGCVYGMLVWHYHVIIARIITTQCVGYACCEASVSLCRESE